MSEWIDIEERTPDKIGTKALIFPIDDDIGFGTYAGEGWWNVEDFSIHGERLTHWMPLPEPPNI